MDSQLIKGWVLSGWSWVKNDHSTGRFKWLRVNDQLSKRTVKLFKMDGLKTVLFAFNASDIVQRTVHFCTIANFYIWWTLQWVGPYYFLDTPCAYFANFLISARFSMNEFKIFFRGVIHLSWPWKAYHFSCSKSGIKIEITKREMVFRSRSGSAGSGPGSMDGLGGRFLGYAEKLWILQRSFSVAQANGIVWRIVRWNVSWWCPNAKSWFTINKYAGQCCHATQNWIRNRFSDKNFTSAGESYHVMHMSGLK